jgi:hypothetical protein
MFVHALGKIKPWHFADKTALNAGRITYMRLVTYELSAYFIAASEYSHLFNSASWLSRRTMFARILSAMTGHGMATSGLPFAVLSAAISTIRRIRWKSLESVFSSKRHDA